jgi:glycerophosphoryl diester phosphodiesterase
MFNNQKLRIVTKLLLAIVTFTILLKISIRYIDLNYCQENIYDTWGALTTSEDWSKAQPLPKNLDSSWLSSEKKDGVYYIAHALGGAETSTSNTYSAFLRSKERGFKLYEVDVFLDAAGFLRCHHGPESPPKYDPQQSCTLDTLLPMIDKSKGWAVLDIKTDFRVTADKVISLLNINHLHKKVIFQLYNPDELTWFNNKAKQYNLSTPIITVYKSRRSANHIAKNAKKLNIRVLTVPFKRLRSMENIQNIQLFTHPIHNCKDWSKTNYDIQITGIYALSSTDISICH